MLQIIVQGNEYYNEATNEISRTNDCSLNLEHSLVSISKWEAKWQKPFFGNKEKTDLELLDYIKCMTINSNMVKDETYAALSEDNIKEISAYINSPMTATTFSSRGENNKKNETITSELIYYWMVAYNIPPEYQKWHINRLLTLIRICGIKNNPNGKKMSKAEILSRNKALNAQRRASLGTKG